MSTIAWHLMFRLVDQRVIAPSTAERRTLARTVYESCAAGGLLAFRGSDTHLHAVVLCDRVMAGAIARNLAIRLRWALDLDTRFDATRFQPVQDQRHLSNAVEYVLRQDVRHGFENDRLHDASLLPDLLGLRLLGPEVVRRFREHLPRLGRSSLLGFLGVPDLEPGT
ncbi:MAG: hypothetical protein JXB39_04590, partial [Deltaproteobacteria bacterium]|nr:hypothetical protein [Deltaproteobacteria bacterium]